MIFLYFWMIFNDFEWFWMIFEWFLNEMWIIKNLLLATIPYTMLWELGYANITALSTAQIVQATSIQFE